MIGLILANVQSQTIPSLPPDGVPACYVSLPIVQAGWRLSILDFGMVEASGN
jgi:hypothetical protein